MFDERVTRRLLKKIPHGFYVGGATSRRNEEQATFAVRWMSQGSFNPPIVTLAVPARSKPAALIRDSNVFAVSFLESDAHGLSEAHEADERSMAHHPGMTGCPIVDEAVGAIECSVIQIVEYGDHDVVIGEVIATEDMPLDRSTRVVELPLHPE